MSGNPHEACELFLGDISTSSHPCGACELFKGWLAIQREQLLKKTQHNFKGASHDYQKKFNKKD
jgi:hypothetical protein